MEEILADVWKIEVPLPRNPLKSINSYILLGEERNLMIDTGMKRPECLEVLEKALKELKLNLSKTDFFITHLHSDHLGLVNELAASSSIIYFNRPDMELINKISFWDKMADIAKDHGFPREEVDAAVKKHPGRIYNPDYFPKFTLLEDGDMLNVGDYSFRCIATPGHSPGHLCLFEPEKKIIFSGDHILGDITPNISGWLHKNPLHHFLNSLDKVASLNPQLVLPGHRKLISNCQQRISELKEHHKLRAEEAKAILESNPGNAYQVASKMEWDINLPSWEDYPVAQKWFATGEALAHLKYLQAKGEIKELQGSHGDILFNL